MSTPTPSTKRQLRTSHPTPPEKLDIKKHKTDILEMNSEDDMSVAFDNSQPIVSAHISLSDEDVQRIAAAVKIRIQQNIHKIVDEIIEVKTKPLVDRISQLESDNRKLRYDLDELEQYGRRSLIRVSGIPESEG